MAKADVEVAKRSLQTAGFNTTTYPATEALQAIADSDQKMLLTWLAMLGIPLSSPLGQALMRLCTP